MPPVSDYEHLGSSSSTFFRHFARTVENLIVGGMVSDHDQPIRSACLGGARLQLCAVPTYTYNRLFTASHECVNKRH